MDELRPTATDNAGQRSSAMGSAGAEHEAAAKQGEAQAHEAAPISARSSVSHGTRLVRC